MKKPNSSAAELEGYYVKMFGEVLGPFTDSELRYGVQAQEFPVDATFSDKKDGAWNPIQSFGKPVPPPFKKKVVPPPFRKKAA